ncbi:hypothetical protein [Agromyces intestinalis]|nr:hypothetical protein [Agromyces intestinalis]
MNGTARLRAGAVTDASSLALDAGTAWTVRETLRTVYIAPR